MNAQVIGLVNQKGGVTKSTSCVNLAAGLAQAGKKVVVVDADPQSSMTISLGYPQPDRLPVTLSDMRTNYSREIVDLLHSTYGSKLRIFDSIIPMSIRAAETSAEGRSIYLHDPAGKVSAAYAALTREVLT